jgi:hypothetical protein
MASRTFELTTTIPAKPSEVIDFMVDLTRHHGMHPFVVRAEIIDSGTDGNGSWEQWRVVERPRLGPIRYTIRFPAKMTRTSETSMVGDVKAAPGCTLVTTTTARLVDGLTRLAESTTVTAPLLLVGYMTSQAHVAHARTFSLLPSQFA